MEYMPSFRIHRPKCAQEAVEILKDKPVARFVAGGTDMIVNIRRGIEQPENLVDLTSIEEIKNIREDKDGLHIGAGVTINEVAKNASIKSAYRAVGEAAASVAGGTHQQYGTLGGNLCLDTRCLF